MGSFARSWRCPGVGNGCPLQYSCLENTMGRGAWWAIVHGFAKSWTWLNTCAYTTHTHTHILHGTWAYFVCVPEVFSPVSTLTVNTASSTCKGHWWKVVCPRFKREALTSLMILAEFVSICIFLHHLLGWEKRNKWMKNGDGLFQLILWAWGGSG